MGDINNNPGPPMPLNVLKRFNNNFLPSAITDSFEEELTFLPLYKLFLFLQNRSALIGILKNTSLVVVNSVTLYQDLWSLVLCVYTVRYIDSKNASVY